MVGEVIGTGGTALKTDLIQRKLDFFRNLAEHVQIVGVRKIVDGSVQAAATDEFYTVPSNTLYFIFGIILDSRNTGAGNAAVRVYIKGGGNLLRITSNTNYLDSKNIVFSSPLMLRTGEVLVLEKNNSNVNHECNCSSIGYEIPSEIAG